MTIALLFPVAGKGSGEGVKERRKQIICKVFGKRYCKQAIAVAECESHLDTWATNGQYLGMFQMGSHERRIYGHGRGAWAQARAARRYFIDSGKDWSPWSCRWAAY